jgi:hypothetical protein
VAQILDRGPISWADDGVGSNDIGASRDIIRFHGTPLHGHEGTLARSRTGSYGPFRLLVLSIIAVRIPDFSATEEVIMATDKSGKSAKKPSIKPHKLKTSKKLSGVRTLKPNCTGLSMQCGATY